MQQLSELVCSRMHNSHQVLTTTIPPQRVRVLKQQQRVRCERENSLVSMMRANKSVQIVSKHLYYRYSYDIMRAIQPTFIHPIPTPNDHHFLNDYVALYRIFFHHYEQLFNFKLKITSLIRPTNHNLVIDLVRYLVDFSRDYYQQILFWYVRQHYKVRGQFEERRESDQNADAGKLALDYKKIERGSLSQIAIQRSVSKKINEEADLPKKDLQKNYQILDIAALPSICGQPKDTSNLEVLKLRINEFYRQMKSRNNLTKANINGYHNRYFGENGEHKHKDYVEQQNEDMNRATHPFKLTLNVQKNGLNFISVTLSENKLYIRARDKKLSPLKASQRLIHTFDTQPNKQQFMVGSLKIIRISDNFLPPIPHSHLTIAHNHTSLTATPENPSRLHILSSSSAVNEQQFQRRLKKPVHNLSESATYHSTIIEKHSTFDKLAKEISYRHLNDIKMHFKAEDKKEIPNPARTNTNGHFAREPEKKIMDWLEKLRQVKELQRRKIMGLN